MKTLNKYIFPAALVAGFLYYFFYDLLFYRFVFDDCFYDGVVRKLGIGGSIDLCYKILNGRWFSHIVSVFSFYFLQYNHTRYAVYLTFLLVLFLFGVSTLHKNYNKTFLQKNLSFLKNMGFSLVFTATLYFLLFEGRWEIWGWVSSANNHLISIIICLYLFTLLIKEKQNIIFVFILSAFLGGLNEVNAICSIMLVMGLLLLNRFYFPTIKLSKLNLLVAVLTIGISLLVNIYSGGYRVRMDGLPDFTLIQSLKNTAHSFLIPFIHYKYLPFILGALLVFFLFLKQGAIKVVSKRELVVFVSAFVIVIVSFFLHCYSLSDIMPPRGEIWGYTLLLFVIATKF